MSTLFSSTPFNPEICGTVGPRYIAPIAPNKPPDAKSGALSMSSLVSQGGVSSISTSLRHSACLAPSTQPIKREATTRNVLAEPSDNQERRKVPRPLPPAGDERAELIITPTKTDYDDDLTVEELLQHVTVISFALDSLAC